MTRAALALALVLLAGCGVDGPPQPVPGGVALEGPRIRVVGGV